VCIRWSPISQDRTIQGRVKITLPWSARAGASAFEGWRLARMFGRNNRGSWFVPTWTTRCSLPSNTETRVALMCWQSVERADQPPEQMDGAANNYKKVLARAMASRSRWMTRTGKNSSAGNARRTDVVTLKDGPVRWRWSTQRQLDQARGGRITINASAKVTIMQARWP